MKHVTENKMQSLAREHKTATVTGTDPIILRDDETGEEIRANRAIFGHDDVIAAGDRYRYELVHATQTANRVTKVETQS